MQVGAGGASCGTSARPAWSWMRFHLVLGRQAHRLAGSRAFQRQKARLQAIDLTGQSQRIGTSSASRRSFQPAASGPRRWGARRARNASSPGLLVPQAVVGVAAGLDEAAVLAVA